ncbi:TPA: hypothetical protein ACIA9H_003708 [Salmonella enterica subsp. enterica serovar Typhimurium]|uniref:hypothetical protein n=1 Tax=Escherichia coli TaxID=562 RepID=UPI00066ECB02|nr:hypothetical protein [Escherichia coli]KMV54268.1 hypothetical protein ACM21_23835 [Escherichia coli]
MTTQANPNEFTFLVKKKKEVNFNDETNALLHRVLKNKVSFETYCRIENHDDYNHVFTKRKYMIKLIALIICLSLAGVGFLYINKFPVLILFAFVLSAVFGYFIYPRIIRNFKYAVSSVILWGFVYDSLLDEEFRGIFRERLYGKDILFREDLEFLQAEQQRLFEEAKAKGQDLTPDLKGKIL